MRSTENVRSVAAPEQSGRAAVRERYDGATVFSATATIDGNAVTSCTLDALKGWRWKGAEPVQPVRRLTLFQRLYSWLYDYNRY